MITNKLNLHVPLNHTGYGVASWNILKELNKEYDITLFPIGDAFAFSQEDRDLAVKCSNNIYNCDPTAPSIKIWHQFDLISRIGRGKYFALPFFELDTFNDIEKIHLNCPNHIFVTCDWAKQVIINNTSRKAEEITVIPLGVDTSIFYPRPEESLPSRPYRFFNIGKWEVRKGHDILLNIFQKAFPTEQDVELHILASENTNSYSSPADLYRWKSMYQSDPRVKLYAGVDSHQDIADFISTKHCGIFPSRAEGWNLELLESMAMNKPVIATDYSAHKEFCTSKNCFLIDVAELESAYDGKAFRNQGNWAKISQKSFDQAVDYMRYCYQYDVLSNPAGLETAANNFTWSHTARCIKKCLDKST